MPESNNEPSAAGNTHAHILPGMQLLEAEGPEAEAFLQSQLSSDLSTLQPGGAQWSAWLNPKGRVIALGLLARLQADIFWMLLPDHPADSLAAALGRYVLRRKARLRARPDLAVAAVVGEPAAMSTALLELSLQGQPPRHLSVIQAGTAPTAGPDFEQRWRRLDMAAGVPRLDAEGGSHTAHMLSLERLGALSLTKGCYPGQEIVARTHYLGHSKRGLARLRMAAGATPPVAGTPVLREGAAVGEVLCAVEAESGCEVQAVLALDAMDALEIEAQQAQRLDLEPPPIARLGS